MVKMTGSIDDKVGTEVSSNKPTFKSRWTRYFYGLDFLDSSIRDETLRTLSAATAAGEHVGVSMSNCLRDGLVVFRNGTFEYTDVGKVEWDYFQKRIRSGGHE